MFYLIKKCSVNASIKLSPGQGKRFPETSKFNSSADCVNFNSFAWCASFRNGSNLGIQGSVGIHGYTGYTGYTWVYRVYRVYKVYKVGRNFGQAN